MEKHPREEMMVRDLDVTKQALRIENREAERLRSCLSIADRETTMAEAAAG